ncbi:MAG: STAS domain-containing protein [Candidatus Latescibacterota bacterium]|nr:MAG: STAS domain-containing protein [Candidatus Latescibacterota bacterium]
MKFSQRDYEGYVTLDLKGKLTGGPEAETFRDLFKSLVQQDKKHVIINLRDIEWISSTGIGILIRGYKTVREAGGEFVIVRVGERTQQVFNVLRLDHIFKIAANEDEAVEFFKKS